MQRWHASAKFFHGSWSAWYANCHIHVLDRARSEARQLGVSLDLVCVTLRNNPSNVPRTNCEARFRRLFQRCAYQLLLAREGYNAEHHFRRRLQRWLVPGAPPAGTLARRGLNRMQTFFRLVAPHVAIVVFRAWFNGWCTARRFQDRSSRCVLHCCRLTAEDSIEHYAFCPIVKDFALTSGISQQAHCPLLSFLALEGVPDEDHQTLQILLLYAVYSATNVCRKLLNEQPHRLEVDRHDLLMQFAKQATFGHAKSRKVLELALRRRYVRQRI